MSGTTIEQHTRMRRIELGEWVMARERVYLDKCFWINLRDVRLGRSRNPAASALLESLAQSVSQGHRVCPISDWLFIELMKQGDAYTRLATAKLIDELSCGVTLAPHPERVATEVAHLLHLKSRHAVHPLEVLAWSKVSYVLGEVHPAVPGVPESQLLALQQAFFDHMWTIPLVEMLARIDVEGFPAPPYTALAGRLNEGNAAHSNRMRSFNQVYRDEVYGALEEAVPIAAAVLGRMAVTAGYSQEMAAAEHGSVNREVYAFLCAAIAKDDVRRALRTLHIGATLHAAVRWNRKQKLVANDLYDFHHAEAAVGYCDVFLTDGPMRALLTQRHLGIEQDFPCRTMSSWDEILDWAQKSSATGQPS